MTKTTNTPIQPCIQPRKTLVLASSSPYRKRQLEQLGLQVQTYSPNIDETPTCDEAPKQLALRLASAKATAIGSLADGPSLVIGSDQTASCNGELLGKPGSADNAEKQLALCSGQRVHFYTALSLFDTHSQSVQVDVISTRVKFRTLSTSEIKTYIRKEEPLNCAGSFKCEGLGIALFDSISSDDPSALIGLPLIRLTSLLREFGYNVIENANNL